MTKLILFFLGSFPLSAVATCWELASAHFGIDPSLIKAIAWKESRGHPNAVGQKLKDGNVALGLMQINSIHLENLKQFGIDRDKLFDACINQQVGAWVLANCIAKFGPVWKAVGCYYTGPNSTNVAAQVAYVRDVQRFYAGYKKQEQHQAQVNQGSKAI
jgi:soluble lytic murein transglycosylase-like protein